MAKTIAYILFFISAFIAIGCIPMLINVVRAHRKVSAALRTFTVAPDRQMFDDKIQAAIMPNAGRESLQEVKEVPGRRASNLQSVVLLQPGMGKSHMVTELVSLAAIRAHAFSV